MQRDFQLYFRFQAVFGVGLLIARQHKEPSKPHAHTWLGHPFNKACFQNQVWNSLKWF